ncbi:hypothetical protein EUGRSUZ_F01940 [Eucalyptus grandis]|uniref:Uncharacterized protein n=2 Tax=Eucalyptus grandis TaxID=71139 RepID=A0ACC3KGJ8_EUCGR|nr:hypothetical protein EUGRSUZ_F01940 [Eucalyptus grandis]
MRKHTFLSFPIVTNYSHRDRGITIPTTVEPRPCRILISLLCSWKRLIKQISSPSLQRRWYRGLVTAR